MSVFATVGTTRFDALVEALDTVEVPSLSRTHTPWLAHALQPPSPPPFPGEGIEEQVGGWDVGAGRIWLRSPPTSVPSPLHRTELLTNDGDAMPLASAAKGIASAPPHAAARSEPAGQSSVSRLATPHPGGNPWANLKSISHRCYLFEIAFVWELTKETIHLPLGCLQGG